MTVRAQTAVAAHPVAADFSEPLLPSPWLVSRGVDGWFILGGALLLSLLLSLAARSLPALALAGALFAMLTDMPHVLATTVRIGLDPQERSLHGRRYCVSLLVIASGTLALFVTGNRPLVAMVWIVWQFFHVVKQHYGIVRIYGAKARYRGSFRWLAAVLALGCGSPVLYRLGQGMRFGEYFVFGQRMPFSGLGLPEIPVPDGLILAMYAAFAIAAGLFLREQLQHAKSGAGALPWSVLLTLALAVGSYNLSYLLVGDLYALIMIATTMHSLQYHVICWRRNCGRYARGEVSEQGSGELLRTVSQKKNVLGYALLVVGVGAACANTELLWLGFIPFVLVLHHFYMDGYIWRSALNPTLAQDLGIARGGRVSAARTP